LSLQFLRSVPEEEVWLAGQLSRHTRRAYQRDVADFVRAMGFVPPKTFASSVAPRSSPGRTS